MSVHPQNKESSRLRALLAWIDARVPLTQIIASTARR